MIFRCSFVRLWYCARALSSPLTSTTQNEEASQADFAMAMKLEPKNPDVYAHQGELLFAQCMSGVPQFAECQSCLEKAVSLEPR